MASHILLPKRLIKNSTIAIVAPSKPIDEQKKIELKNFENYMKSESVNVKLSKNLFAVDKFGVSAGTPEERAHDINSMFSDKKIDAIWCFQGGDTANQTLDLIDYEKIKENPKLFMGKSDIDVLLLAINKMTGLITIHCCDPKIGSNREMDLDYTKKWFKKRLFDGEKEIEPSCEWVCLRDGKSSGGLIGCNLTSILKLAGTKYFPDFNESILFIETYKSNAAKVICQLTQLEKIGVFEKIKGIVIGSNFEFDSGNKKLKVEDIVKELTSDYKFPILKINEFGHYQPHAFLPIGAKVELDATNKKLAIVSDFLE